MRKTLVAAAGLLLAASAGAMHTNAYWDISNVGTGRYDAVSSWALEAPPATAASGVPADGYRANFTIAGIGPAYVKFTDYRITFPEGGLGENSVTHMRGVRDGRSVTYDTTGTWWLKSPGFVNGIAGATSNYPLLFAMSHTEGLSFFRIGAASATSGQYGFLLSNAVLTVSMPAGGDGLQRVDLSQGYFNWYDPMGHETSPNSVLEIGYGSGTTPVEVNFHPASSTRGRRLTVARRTLNILGGTHEIVDYTQVGAEVDTDLVVDPTLHVSGGTFRPTGGLWIGARANHPGSRAIVDGDGRMETAGQVVLVKEKKARASLTLAGDSTSSVAELVAGSADDYAAGDTAVWGELVMSNNATLAVTASATIGSKSAARLTMSGRAELDMGAGIPLNVGASAPGQVVLEGESVLKLDAAGIALHSENSVKGTAELVIRGSAKVTCPGVNSEKIKIGNYQGEGARLLLQDDGVLDAVNATLTVRGTNTVVELAGGSAHFKGCYNYGAMRDGAKSMVLVSGGSHTAGDAIYAANIANGRGVFRMTGGVLNCTNNNDVYVSSGTEETYGRIELLGGTLHARVRRGGGSTFNGSASFHADGGTVHVRNSSTFNTVENFESATLGPKGLTIDTDASAGYDAYVQQSFADAAVDAPGRLVKVSKGRLYAKAASQHGETVVAGGSLLPTGGIATFGRTLVVTNGASLVLTGNLGAGLSAGRLVLGDSTSGGTLEMGAGDVVTLTEDMALSAPRGTLAYAPAAANGTYTVFRCKGAVDLGVFNALSVPAVPSSSRYAFVTEADGTDTLVKLVVYTPGAATENTWLGTNGSWADPSNWSGGQPSTGHAVVLPADSANRQIVVADGVSVSSLGFTGGDYTLSGAGSISGSALSSLAGSNVLDVRFIPIGDMAIDVAAGGTLELSGGLEGARASSVTKGGSGLLKVTEEESTLVSNWNLTGGRTSFASPSCLGLASDSPQLGIGATTLTIEGAGEMTRNVTLNAGAGKAAIADIRGDVTVNGSLTATSGGFVKRGAGTLTLRYPAIAYETNYYLDRDQLSLAGGDYRPATCSRPISFDASGDFLPQMTNGLGGLNVLAGKLRLEGCSFSAQGSPLTKIIQNYWTIVGGEWADAEANAELELAGVKWQNNSNYMRFALGVKVPQGAPNRPTLRVVDGSYMKMHGLFLGDGDQGEDVYPTLAVTNATVEVPYHLYVGPLNVHSALNHPTVRIGTGGRVSCTYTSSDRKAVLLGENSDVVVADGGILETADGLSGVTFGQYACGSVAVRDGGLLKTCRFQSIVARESAVGAAGLAVSFDGGVLEMIGADNMSVVHSPDFWMLETRGAGLELRAAEGVRHVFALPISGEGRVVKTGAGEIVLAKGLQLGSAGVTNDSGLVTANWTGLTEVSEGKLTICGDAARSDLAVRIAENAVLDLDGAAVKIGLVSGRGRIVNGTLSCTIAIPFGTPEYELAALGDTAVGRVTVDFGATGGQKVEIGTVLPVARWSGAVPFDARQWRGVNLGDGVRAQFALVDGTVYATAVPPSGVLLIVW